MNVKPKTRTRAARRGLLRLAALSVSLALVAAQGCARRDDGAKAEGEIIVAAAANLTDAFGELARRFNARTGVRVTLSFGATADLARQIENGAPFDVFAAADTSHVDELARRGLLTDGTRAVYARGRLVVWTPAGSGLQLERVEDLAGARVSKVAIAKPDAAPYGQAAVESLRALNVWQQVEPKVVYAQSVAQARQWAAAGEADAALLPRSLVRDGEGRAIEVDARLHPPIDQALAVVRASKKQDEARRFVEFVTGEEGQSVLKNFGYDAPGK
ncbi:MAG: molybdate ABC transporter substrate-binding protein [Acidobacteriota bacterium]|nr:molybdate ABC transporter substrate-binding protein [Acidobacteriota bacterium]